MNDYKKPELDEICLIPEEGILKASYNTGELGGEGSQEEIG